MGFVMAMFMNAMDYKEFDYAKNTMMHSTRLALKVLYKLYLFYILSKMRIIKGKNVFKMFDRIYNSYLILIPILF